MFAMILVLLKMGKYHGVRGYSFRLLAHTILNKIYNSGKGKEHILGKKGIEQQMQKIFIVDGAIENDDSAIEPIICKF